MGYYREHEPKGECVLVMEGKSRQALREEEQAGWMVLSLEEHMEHYLSRGMDKKEAMKRTAKDRGVGKREIYRQLLERE